jgi:hypothetical protein
MSEEVIQNKTDYSVEPEGHEIENFPEYITTVDDDKYKVKMRDGSYYIIADVEYADIKRVIDRSRSGEGKIKEDHALDGLLKKAILYPKMDDEKINKLKGSHFFKLQKAFNVIFDIEGFL